ncbi:head-to-tail adaptor [Mycobacterium phage Typha]|uniref:Head-to-tail adaptor n=1 Tax=Mycobacterium phage Typha TaxID=2517971 RepID=A0A482JDJ5_9CAUD|nr:head-tail adaptor [Mycobacterium phage Typha]QBP29672.1 head-to-tail adaptor [Mycobacterium phage Typha]URM86459.1 head-to-tail adaptor [Mycobacterium phage Hilltopfarm]
MALELVKVTDLAKLEDGEDAEFFLAAAEAAVRDYCGWHLAPSRTVTERVPLGERGLIVLKTMHLTAVTSVVVNGEELDPEDYDWEACGVITRTRPSWPNSPRPKATVTFTHGYTDCPPNVAMVVLELASLAKEMPASPAKDVYAGPFRMSLANQLGNSLNPDQKSRLANYRVTEFGFGVF